MPRDLTISLSIDRQNCKLAVPLPMPADAHSFVVCFMWSFIVGLAAANHPWIERASEKCFDRCDRGKMRACLNAAPDRSTRSRRQPHVVAISEFFRYLSIER
jgi:hypothetical protein